MSRRLAPYLFAGLVGVVSGVYIFKPLFESAATQRVRGATGSVKPIYQSQTNTASREGK